MPKLSLCVLLAGSMAAVTIARTSAGQAPAVEESAGSAAPSVSAAGSHREAQVLFREVMSPFCPGLTLADCPSPAAFQLRQEIEARLARGETRRAVVDALAAEYGATILSDPSGTPMGRVVWGVPFLLAAMAALGVALFVRRASRTWRAEVSGREEMPASVRERLNEELSAID